MRKIRIILLALLALAFISANASTNNSFIIGVGTHLGQQRLTAEQARSLMSKAGASSFRDEVYWGRTEKEQGKLAFHPSLRELDELVTSTIKNGGSPIIILDYGNKFYDNDDGISSTEGILAFSKYARFVAQHFKGRVKLFEVWNEWNIGMGSNSRPRNVKSTDTYIQLLDATRKAVKEEIPDAIIIAGSVAGPDDRWIQGFIDAGGIGKLDAFSVHPYFYDRKNKTRPEDAITWLEGLNSNISKYSSSKKVPIYVTEIGWPNHKNQDYWSTQQTADFLIRFYLQARSLDYIQGVWWYELINAGTDPNDKEKNFGLAERDMKEKPALSAMSVVSKILQGATSVKITTTDTGIYQAKIDSLKTGQCIGFWTKNGTRYHAVDKKYILKNTLWGSYKIVDKLVEISETPLLMCSSIQ